jgi:succinate-semialdehyde dehydrogenase/glutarate-semialdehyde dehydrogenase
VSACFLCAGQSCTAGERLLVHERVREEFVERLAARGAPRCRSATRSRRDDDGPAQQRAGGGEDGRARRRRGRARRDAWSRRRARGRLPTRLYWQATILDGVPADAEAAREETFGPIAPSCRSRSLEEAIELTNASPYGLLAAIFTGDVMDGLRFADRVRTGLVNINETTNYWENHLPFGGRAGTDSGTGRIGGRHALERLTELQTIVIGG